MSGGEGGGGGSSALALSADSLSLATDAPVASTHLLDRWRGGLCVRACEGVPTLILDMSSSWPVSVMCRINTVAYLSIRGCAEHRRQTITTIIMMLMR